MKPLDFLKTGIVPNVIGTVVTRSSSSGGGSSLGMVTSRARFCLLMILFSSSEGIYFYKSETRFSNVMCTKVSLKL